MNPIKDSAAPADSIKFTFPGKAGTISVKPHLFRVFIFFSLALISIFLFIRFINFYSSDTNKTDLMVFEKYEIIREVGNIKSSLAESEVAARNYQSVPDEDNLGLLHDEQNNIRLSLKEALTLVKDSMQKARLTDLGNLIEKQVLLQAGNISDTAYASVLLNNQAYKNEAREITHSIQNLLDVFIKRQNLLLGEGLTASKFAKKKALTIAVAGMSFFFIFVTVALFRLNKDIGRRKKAARLLNKSEELTRALLNNTSEGILIIDRNFKILLINKQSIQELELLTGRKPERGMHFFQFILPKEREQSLENFKKVFDGEKLTREAEYITTSGKKWMLISHSPVKDDEGNITAIAIIVHDITEKKQQDLLLKKSENRFRLTLEKLGDNFWEHDFTTNITSFSKAGYEFLGYEEGDFDDNVTMWWQNIHPDDRDMLVENDRRYKAGQIDFHTSEYRMICKDKSIKWILDRGVVTDKNAEGKPLKILGTHTNITRLKIAEEKIRDSDQKIRAMLQSNREGFYMIDFDFQILMVNEAGRNHIKLIMGKDATHGDNILDFIPPERRLSFKASVERVRMGHREDKEVEINTSEGKKWFQNRYFPVYSDKNEIIGLCASSKDITENKLIDNALIKVRAEREEFQFRLQSILDNTPLIIFIKDLEGRYLVVNKSFRETLKRDEHDLIGNTDFEIDTPERALHYKQLDDEVIKTLRSVETEETIVKESGTQNLLLVKFPLFDKKNNIYGIGGIATDYTEKVQYRQKLIEAKKAAESAEQLQEQFLANMSHEIRTPMNGIIGMTNILMNTDVSEEQKGFIDIIRQSSDTLLFLINDILDLSKIKSGKLSIEKIVFNLHEVIENALQPFRIRAQEKNVEVKLIKDMRVPQMLEGDPYRLNQIINNLCSNALKFTHSGSITFTSGMAEQSGTKAVIRFIIKDTGIGIPANKLKTIFNSFEQATTSTARQFGGTGLGLTITKQLIEMQGGQITVSSDAEEGTEFTLEIPYNLVKEQHIPVNDNLLIRDSFKELAGKKILVAEDNEVNQKVIFHILKKEGMLSTITNNGREAVDLLEKGEVFDIIILDLQMPEMDGLQAATYIRQKLKLDTPIIALTASALRQERTKCLEVGMNEYMTKPFSSAELFRQLKALLPGNSQGGKSYSMKENGYYDLSLLHAMNNNDHLCNELKLFLDAMPANIEQAKEEALHENWDLLSKTASNMKANLSILQVTHMLALVEKIESRAKEKNELEKIPLEINKLSELYGLIRPMIENELITARRVNAAHLRHVNN
ncbi:MAG: PAS domain S-box protein [Bacteroidota bacterium]|nr:PAS domain S-box protein [Bacteroidota bacterium]